MKLAVKKVVVKDKEYYNFYIVLASGRSIAIDPHSYGKNGSSFRDLLLIAEPIEE